MCKKTSTPSSKRHRVMFLTYCNRVLAGGFRLLQHLDRG